MIKKRLKCIVFIAFAMIIGRLDAQTIVKLTFNDASTQEIEVNSYGSIYFSDNYMYINDGNSIPFSFDVANIRNMIFDETAAIHEIETENFKVFPNPAQNEIFISGNTFQSYNYEIYSIVGSLMIKGSCNDGDPINVSSLPAGLYILKINNTSLKINKL